MPASPSAVPVHVPALDRLGAAALESIGVVAGHDAVRTAIRSAGGGGGDPAPAHVTPLAVAATIAALRRDRLVEWRPAVAEVTSRGAVALAAYRRDHPHPHQPTPRPPVVRAWPDGAATGQVTRGSRGPLASTPRPK